MKFNKLIGFNNCLFIIILLLSAGNTWGQNAPVNIGDYNKMTPILPPPPNAASLGKYGSVNTLMSSGAVNFSIPLDTYNSKYINVPISLSYTSNGVKVDEIASRTGMQWNLNCGGVITRTAHGNIDDFAVNGTIPSLVPSTDLIVFADAISNQVNVNTYSAPDIFSFNFNGYSGKFILDTAQGVIKIQGNPILLTYSELKIETAGNGDYQFKIITPEGSQYLFGSSTSTEYSYGYPSGAGCGMPYNANAATAYYLSKIIHPNNDTVNFVYTPITYNYKTSTTETIYSKFGNLNQVCDSHLTNFAPNPPDMINSACLNWLETKGVLLQEINSSSGGKVKFNYINRSDYNDRLVSNIQVFKPNEITAFKTFSLAYLYSYSGSSNYVNSYTTDELKYRPFLASLTETGISGSFTKTHRFFYKNINGLPPRLSFSQDDYGFFNGKNNTTLIPLPDDPINRQYLPLATANRSVDPNYSANGMLTSIVYPTGGKDSVVYESNDINASVVIEPQNANITATAYSQTLSGGGVTGYSTLAVSSILQQATLTASCSSGTAGEANFKTTNVYFTDETAGTVVLNQTLQYNQSLNQTFLLNENHSYKLKVTVTGADVTGTASLAYKSGVSTIQNQNVNSGGVRVSKVITTDNVTNTSNIKKYNYGSMNNPAISSGGNLYSVQYNNMLNYRAQCGETGGFSCDPLVYTCYSMHSNSVFNVYTHGPSPVAYSTVKESFGENYENGGIEHSFTIETDFPAGNSFGDVILNAGETSLDFKSGLEVYNGTFKKQGSTYLYVKKVFTHYKEDPRVDHSIHAYVASKNFQNRCTYPGCYPEYVAFSRGQYNLSHYLVYQKWIYPDTVKTWTYDATGQNYLEDKVITEYGNPIHALPTKISSFTSDMLVKTQTNFYPGDLTLTGNAETARQQLIAKNMSPALQQKVTKNNSQQFLLNTEYNVFQNGLVLPKRKIIQIANKPPESRIEFNNYDNKGNILEESQTDGTSITYLWGYNQRYPVAEIKNATYQAVLNAIGQTAIIQLNSNPGSDVQVRNILSTLRTSLPNVLMTTYTYDPLVGMTSSTDAKGMTTTYEYDGFQRLINVKHKDGNIVKHTDYHYQGQ